MENDTKWPLLCLHPQYGYAAGADAAKVNSLAATDVETYDKRKSQWRLLFLLENSPT